MKGSAGSSSANASGTSNGRTSGSAASASASGGVGGASKNSNSRNNNNNNNMSLEDFNPHWKGYAYILLASFINIMAISDIDREAHDLSGTHGRWGVSLSFGIVLFAFSLTVLVTDRCWQLGNNSTTNASSTTTDTDPKENSRFSYHKAKDGKIEGLCLLIATLYTLVAVAYQTQVRGVAYLALNVYGSAWLLPVAAVYTLNEWSTAHDILTLHELTGVSVTLKSWYIVGLASVVVTGTCLNMLMALDDSGVDDNREDNDSLSTTTSLTTVLPMYRDNERAAVFGVAFGTFSTIVAVWFILTHYNLVECCSCRGFIKEGGGVELFAILVIILLWIVGTAVLTQYGGLAATIIGSGADQYKMHQEQIVRVEQESKTREYPPTLAPVTTSANPPESLSLEQILLHQLLATGNISNATFNVSSGNDTNVANITNTSNSSNNTTAEPLPYPASIQLDCVFTVHNVSYSCQDLWNSNSTEFAIVRINSTNANGSATTETSTTENATRTIQTIPGSNLYVAVWICLLASLNLAFRWKAQQALQFAQAAQQKAFTSIAEKDKEGRNDREGGGDDDDNEIDQSDDDYDDD